MTKNINKVKNPSDLCLQCELDWIDKNKNLYSNIETIEKVKHNIEVRYRLNQMINQLSLVLDDITD